MKTCCIILLFLAQAVVCSAQNGEKNFIDQNYVEVTGSADMEVIPDEIYMKIVISEKDKGKRTVEELEKDMLSLLKKLNINTDKDLVISDLVSNFKYYVLKSAVAQTTKEYILLLHGTKNMSGLVSGLEKLGISNISVDNVSHSALEKLKTDVKITAIKAAREKAEALASAVGQQIGRAIYINETQGGFYQPKMSNVRIRGVGNTMVANAEDPAIEFEKIELKQSVLVRFELK